MQFAILIDKQRSDSGLKAPPALGGSAMVGRPTGRQIFAVNCTAASPPRPQGRTGAPNLGDDSGRHEDLGTTESTEITERRIRRRETRPRGMRSTSVKLTQGIKRSWIGMDASDGPTWNSLRDLCTTNCENLVRCARFYNRFCGKVLESRPSGIRRIAS